MNRFLLYTLAIFCSFLSIETTAQNYPPPTGVYCSCAPTLGIGNGSVDPNIAAKPFVKGILVRVPWRLLEPQDNAFTWSLIDDQISKANNFGKKISLGVENGTGIPQWLFDKGAQQLFTTLPKNDTIAIPWDSTYLAQWQEFVAELGNKYKNDTTITLVYITNSTANGFEMQMPFQSTPTLADAGYTDGKMIQSWKECIDAFEAAFPNHYLSNDFHPVNGSNAVADSVYNYATNTIGNRYGANAWWWTQKNAKTVYPSQYNITLHSAQNNTFTGVQFANNGTTDSAKFGEGGMPGALQLAIDDGIFYWEIWNQDILNPKFEQLLTDAQCKGTSTANEKITRSEAFNLYPNPTSGTLYIDALEDEQHYTISIYNLTGKLLLQQNSSSKNSILNLGHLPTGFYIALINGDGVMESMKIRVEQ